MGDTPIDTADPAALLRGYCDGLEDTRLERIAAALRREVFAQVPQLASDDAVRATSAESIRQNVFNLIRVAMRGSSDNDRLPSPGLVAAFRVLAEHNVDLQQLLKSFRVAHSAFWSTWMSDVEQDVTDPSTRMALLRVSWHRLEHWFEAQTEEMVDRYLHERQRWLQGAQVRRMDLVTRVLRGESVDPERARPVLGIDLRATHVGLAIWCPSSPTAPALLDEALRAVQTTEPAAGMLSVDAGDAALWAWVSTHSGTPALERLAGALPDSIRIGIGRAAPGAQGFRVTHQEAELARRVADRTSGSSRPESLIHYGDVELAALVSGQPAATRRFILHELGELAADNPHAARLRHTLRVFLDCGANARKASERLRMHKNTVHYRLERAAGLLGRPITERALRLELALHLLAVAGTGPFIDLDSTANDR